MHGCTEVHRKPCALTAGSLRRAFPPQVKYLYDGSCSMCQSLKSVLQRQDNGRGAIIFSDISQPGYQPCKHMGIELDEVRDQMTKVLVELI